MFQHLLTILFLSFCGNSFAQMVVEKPPKKTPKFSKQQIKIEEQNHDCLHRNRYNLMERLNFYPFNKASKIQLVSYDKKDDTNKVRMEVGNELPIANDTICYSQLDEIKTLSNSEIDSLTDILYNVGFKGPVHTFSLTMCFIPRNAILFIDSSGKMFDYVEICFQCQRNEASSDKIELGEFCNEKYDLLKKFFTSSGLEIGTLRWKDVNN